jgi:D-amino-acid dehydrogenase
VDSPALLRGTGIRAPIWPMKGYSVTAPLGLDAPRVSITDVARKLVFCRLSGRMRIAGLADLGTRDLNVDPRRLGSLLASARDSLPDAADYNRLESSWAGLRPMSPSSLPLIRRAHTGVVLNVAHGAHRIGPAQRAASLVLEQAR